MRFGPLVLVLIVACGETTEDTTVSSATTTTTTTAGTSTTPIDVIVEVGNGVMVHLPIVDGDHVEIVFGAAGGWHIDLTGKIEGTSSYVGLLYGVTHVASGETLANHLQEIFAELEGWDEVGKSGLLLNQRAVMYPTDGWMGDSTVCQYADEDLDVCIHVEDLTDRSIQGDQCVRVIADLSPNDVLRCATP